MNDEQEEYFDMLILAGAVEVAGIDEKGDFLYRFTDKMSEIDPTLKETADNIFMLQLRALWEHGFVNMDVSIPNPVVTLTERAHIQEEIDKLPQFLKETINYLINVIGK